MTQKLATESLNQLFFHARTHNAWQDKAVPRETLTELYDLMKWGPTSANCSPARIVFVCSPPAKERLLTCMAPMNVEPTRAAPVNAIIGIDREFYEHLPRLFPQADARSWFVGNDKLIEETATLNGDLQGGYFILAARAVGLDCGPMKGFDEDKLNREFFAGSAVRVCYVCNLGYGDASRLPPRNPRLSFDEACRLE